MQKSNKERYESVEQHDDQLRLELAECPVCGAVGLPERIENHDCQSFLERRGT